MPSQKASIICEISNAKPKKAAKPWAASEDSDIELDDEMVELRKQLVKKTKAVKAARAKQEGPEPVVFQLERTSKTIQITTADGIVLSVPAKHGHKEDKGYELEDCSCKSSANVFVHLMPKNVSNVRLVLPSGKTITANDERHYDNFAGAAADLLGLFASLADVNWEGDAPP